MGCRERGGGRKWREGKGRVRKGLGKDNKRGLMCAVSVECG